MSDNPNPEFSGDLVKTITEKCIRGMAHHVPDEKGQFICSHLRTVFQNTVETVGAVKGMDARCRAVTFTKLEEALMWAIKGVVLGHGTPKKEEKDV